MIEEQKLRQSFVELTYIDRDINASINLLHTKKYSVVFA